MGENMLSEADGHPSPTAPLAGMSTKGAGAGAFISPLLSSAADQPRFRAMIANIRGCKRRDAAAVRTINADASASIKGAIVLTRADVHTLGPGRCINDQIVHAYVHLLVQTTGKRKRSNSQDVCVFSTFAHRALYWEWAKCAKSCSCLPGHTSKGRHRKTPCSACLEYRRAVSRFCKGTKGTKKFLVPLNVSSNHWAYLSVDTCLKTMTYVDSKLSHGSDDPQYNHQQVRDDTERWLAVLGINCTAWDWQVANVTDQRDTLDCGLHMCAHICADFKQPAGAATEFCRVNADEAKTLRLVVAHDVWHGKLTYY